MLSEYKIYCIDDDGHVAMRHDYDARDDLASLERAKELCGQYEMEVWQGKRFVARVTKDGAASFVEPSAQSA